MGYGFFDCRILFPEVLTIGARLRLNNGVFQGTSGRIYEIGWCWRYTLGVKLTCDYAVYRPGVGSTMFFRTEGALTSNGGKGG